MQYYTKQQLQGAGGYSPGVRVGNWNEEVNLQETKLKELLLKQQEGSLKLNKCVHMRLLRVKICLRSRLEALIIKPSPSVQVSATHGHRAAARHLLHSQGRRSSPLRRCLAASKCWISSFFGLRYRGQSMLEIPPVFQIPLKLFCRGSIRSVWLCCAGHPSRRFQLCSVSHSQQWHSCLQHLPHCQIQSCTAKHI